jgi:hypothetical protein
MKLTRARSGLKKQRMNNWRASTSALGQPGTGSDPTIVGDKNGRDHNPQGFSLWMAGGGVKGGTLYGATDEYGYRVIENKLTVHDLHANWGALGCAGFLDHQIRV